MIGVLDNICIKGISAAVPSIMEENMEAVRFLGERRCKKQVKLTGIERRHVSPIGQRISDLCFVAASRLMEKLCWKAQEINVLVLLTQRPNFVAPSTAFLLHKMLGLSQDCVVFDINLGCSAFNVGLQVVSSLLNQCSGEAKGICLQGDVAFNTINEEIPANSMAGNLLFGSCGSATAIEKKAGVGSVPFATYSDGNRYTAIIRRPDNVTEMDGEGVFNFSTNDVVAAINNFFVVQGINKDDVDFFAFHQAQKLILDNIVSACAIPYEKELRSLREFGNTSGASVPLSVCWNCSHFSDKDKINLFSCGFGVGLSWSMAYTPIETGNIIPVIETDKIFSD